MFKTRVIGLFVLITLALIFTGLMLFNGARESSEKVFERQVAMSRPAVVRAHRIRDAEQILVAKAVAESEIGVALELLDEFRADMEALKRGEADPAPAPKKKRRGRRTKVEEKPTVATLADMWVSRYVKRLKTRFGDRFFDRKSSKEFSKGERIRFADCAAIDVSQCYWDYTYNSLPEVLWRVSESRSHPVTSRIVITDSRGTGLADSERPKWSAKAGFAGRAGLPKEATANGGPKKGLVMLNNRMFYATALAITHGGKPVGSVMVADPIDDEMAREDSDIVRAEVTYAKGTEVIATSLDKNVAAEMVRNPLDHDERMTAFFQAFDNRSGADDMKVYVSANMKEMLDGFGSAVTKLFLIAILLLLVGAGILVVLLRSFYGKFETLEQGTHEVINGNLDYQFPFEFKEEICRGLGQSLNLMSLVLQGRPLPEEVEEKEETAWMNDLQVFEGGGAPSAAEDDGASDRVDATAAGVDVRALGQEPADVYYKRVYQEFVEARTTLDLPVTGINYPKFMERLVHLEQGLKKKHRCPMVRFVVSTKENEVVLVPVPIHR